MKALRNFIFAILLFASQLVYSQEKHFLHNLRFDTISMDGRVNFTHYLPNCEVARTVAFSQKNGDGCGRWVVYFCDSAVIVKNWENILVAGQTHTSVMLALCPQYRFFYNDQEFFVGMSAEEISQIFPEIRDPNSRGMVRLWDKHNSDYEDIMGLIFEFSQNRTNHILIHLGREEDLDLLFDLWKEVPSTNLPFSPLEMLMHAF